MRLFLFAAVCAAVLPWSAQAQAQTVQQSQLGNATAVPPAPPIMASPLTPVAPTPAPATPAPPGLVQTPVPPAATTGSTATNSDTGTATPPAATPPATATATPPANNWVPETAAKIRVLNKVDGSISDLSIPVGKQTTAGDLQVSVLACFQRPPDEIPDSAVFLSIQPTSDPSAAPSFRGWMVRSVPAASVVENASETFRLIGCS
jgi:hypothetical protein